MTLTRNQQDTLLVAIAQGEPPNHLIRPYNKILACMIYQQQPSLTQDKALELIGYENLTDLIDYQLITTNDEANTIEPTTLTNQGEKIMRAATLATAGTPIDNAPRAYAFLQELGINPGKTYTKHINIFDTYHGINKTHDEGAATTQKVLDLIRSGDINKVLKGITSAESIQETALGLMWTPERREHITDRLNRDFTADIPTIASELVPALDRWYQTNIASIVTEAAENLPDTLEDLPAIMAAGHQSVDAYNAYTGAKAKHQRLQQALDLLRETLYQGVDKDKGVWKTTRWATVQDLHTYLTITRAAEPLFEAAKQGVELKISFPEEVDDFVESIGRIPE